MILRTLMRLKSVSWCLDRVNIPGVAWNHYENETAFQIYCADWIRKQFSITGSNGFMFWHHSANEREGGKAGFRAKMMGQSRGYPDFVHHGLKLALELKVKGREGSKEQIAWLEHFRRLGYTAEVVYWFERFKALVVEAIGKR